MMDCQGDQRPNADSLALFLGKQQILASQGEAAPEPLALESEDRPTQVFCIFRHQIFELTRLL